VDKGEKGGLSLCPMLEDPEGEGKEGGLRIRTIKPEFAYDFELAKADQDFPGGRLRLFFILLWTHCDKDGWFEYEPNKTKALIFPYEDFDVEDAVTALTPKFLGVYRKEDRVLLRVKTFGKHQRPHHTEKDSDITPFMKSVKEESPDNGGITVKKPLLNRKERRREGKGEGKGMEKGKEKGKEYCGLPKSGDTPNGVKPKKNQNGNSYDCDCCCTHDLLPPNRSA